MSFHERSTQTRSFCVFNIRKENRLRCHSYGLSRGISLQTQRRSQIRIEEFIIHQIGNQGIKAVSKRIKNEYLRDRISKSQLFEVKFGRLRCLFEHHVRDLAIYLKSHFFLGSFYRSLKNVFAARERWFSYIYNGFGGFIGLFWVLKPGFA